MRRINCNHVCALAQEEENAMGKYFIAWLLGVPAVVLIVVYLLFN